MGRGGGSEKCQKTVTYYLNGPLSINDNLTDIEPGSMMLIVNDKCHNKNGRVSKHKSK